MGCFSEDEQKEVLKEFWDSRESKKAQMRERGRRVGEAADAEEDPYRRRVLRWASDNWELVEKVFKETFVTGEEASGLFAVALSLLPADLGPELNGSVISGETYTREELTEKELELTETWVIHLQEKMQTGSACPETERRLAELEAEGAASERPFPVSVELVEENRRTLEASHVNDPQDLP